MSKLTTLLLKGHNRAGFDCENTSLNDYLKKYVNSDSKRNLSICYVSVDGHNNVIGYYTLSADGIPQGDIAESLRKKLPKYERYPVTIIGRLALDKRYKGRGNGGKLLVDALVRIYENSARIASMGVVAHPIDDGAKAFYGKYGFEPLDSGKMYLSMKEIEKIIKPIIKGGNG